ncbi:SIR2 family protein [Sphingobacterium bambusae]|uniref:SIR2 family protein n=1 Tax=Sphingobacterium bambusae TaxID=662858 RepID=A0ABW6BEJ4_9SPHI|nr:SIR2 family protein [Sphingobacterium bambusae]WPL48552.1 SIR2 family protein [Sphingobacterium bambusae]
MSYLLNEKIDELQNLARQPYGIAVFIGAGCSSALKIPLWKDLLIGLNREFKYYYDDNAVKNAIDTDGYPKVASNIKSKADVMKYRELVKKYTKPVACHFTSLHIELVRLSKTIITTNYDDSFEETLSALERFNPDSDCKHQTFSTGDLDIRGIGHDRKIYHIHGTSSSGEVILTEESYLQQYEQPLSGVQTFVSSVFTNYSTVFVGFSFSDKTFVNFLEKAMESIRAEKRNYNREQQKHFCIFSDNLIKESYADHELKGSCSDIALWKSKGILVDYKNKVTGAIEYQFQDDAIDRILDAGLPLASEKHLTKLAQRYKENQEKIKLLNKLNIELIHFEGDQYLQIELILRKLNEPIAAAATTYKPE